MGKNSSADRLATESELTPQFAKLHRDTPWAPAPRTRYRRTRLVEQILSSAPSRTSVLGLVDHSPFGSDRVNLVYAKTIDGEIVHIDDRRPWALGELRCAACPGIVTPVRGDRAHHFRHLTHGEGCGGVETNAHIWAKLVLEEEKAIWIPAVVDIVNGRRRVLFEGHLFKFDKVEVEPWENGRRPDLKVSAVNGKGEVRVLWIEVKVTHACDAAKKQHLIDNDISALEIDLSHLRAEEDERRVRRAFLKTAKREWLHNDAISRARRNRQARLASQAEALIASARNATIQEPSPEMVQAEADLVSLRLGDWIGREVGPSPGFVVPARNWQAAILARLVIKPLSEGKPLDAFRPIDAFDLIGDCLAPGLDKRMSRELVDALKSLDPSFPTPVRVITRYFNKLAADGCLRDEMNLNWSVSREVERRLRTIFERYKDSTGRLAQTKVRVEALLRASRIEGPFDFKAWLERPVKDGRSPRAFSMGDDGTWSRFDAALRTLERMVDEPRPASDLMGLPLSWLHGDATARATEEQARRDRLKAEREAKEAEDRGAILEEMAVSRIGSEAARAWLDEPVAGGDTHRVKAMASDSDLALMKSALRLHADALQRQAQEAADKERNLLEVFRRALAYFGDEIRARLFMTGLNPSLGRRTPEEACGDARGFQACLDLLTRKPNRRR